MDIHTAVDRKIYLRIYNPQKNKVETIFTGLTADQPEALAKLPRISKLIEQKIQGFQPDDGKATS